MVETQTTTPAQRARYPWLSAGLRVVDEDGTLRWERIWEGAGDEEALVEARRQARGALESRDDAVEAAVLGDVFTPARRDPYNPSVVAPGTVLRDVLLGSYAKRVVPPEVRARLKPLAPVGVEMVIRGTDQTPAAPWSLDGDPKGLGEGGLPPQGVPGKAGKKGQSSIAKSARTGKR